MSLDTSIVGTVSPAKRIIVEEGQLKFFAKATGSKNRIYFDVEAAKRAGHRGLPAPPTFLFSLDLLAPSSGPSVLQTLGVSIGKVLHGEQRFIYQQTIYAGDEITLTSEIIDTFEKSGGKLQFIVSETQAKNQNDEAVGKMINTLVIRN